MPRAILTNWLLFLVLIGSIVVAACGSGDEPEEVTFDLRIADRAIAGFDSAVEVKQDDVVTFNVTSDEAASFHLHGLRPRTGVDPPSNRQRKLHRRRHRQLPHYDSRGSGVRR